MVKVDPLRDYYADLELPKNADDADIKRQFRKLGRFAVWAFQPQPEFKTDIELAKPLDGTRTATPATKMSSTPSFRRFKLPTRSLATPCSGEDMMPSERGLHTARAALDPDLRPRRGTHLPLTRTIHLHLGGLLRGRHLRRHRRLIPRRVRPVRVDTHLLRGHSTRASRRKSRILVPTLPTLTGLGRT